MQVMFTNVRKKICLLLAAVLLIGGMLGSAGSVVHAEEGAFTMTLLHENDTHAHLETVAKRITAINEIRAEKTNTLLLHAGDVFSGTLFFNKYLGLADLEFMNYVGYDAMVFGNHEFDNGPETLANFVKAAEFPFVSSNIDFSAEPALSGYLSTEPVSSSAEDAKIYEAIITEVGGEKIGIFGLTTEDTKFLASPGDNIVFENYIDQAVEMVKLLQGEGINKIIALTHLGFEFDKILAEQVEGIDIIVGGHSHTKVAPTFVENKFGAQTLIVQAEEYGKYLGKLDVSFDEEGKIVSYTGELLDTSTYSEDEAALEMLKPYEQGVADIKKQVIGGTKVKLDGARGDVRSKETNLGNLIADGMRAKIMSIAEFQAMDVKGFVAIQNGGGIRDSIQYAAEGKEDGDITLGELLTIMPFGNNITALRMTGEEIVAALENAVSGLETGQGRFAQISGMRYWFDSTKKPEQLDADGIETQKGERVVLVEILNEDGTYSPIDLTAYYFVATNSFMASGGDFYRSMNAAKEDGRQHEMNIVDYEVFWEYINTLDGVNPKVEGRSMDMMGVGFMDAVGHWAQKSIAAALEIGFVTGYEDDTFRPNTIATRAQFVAMLGRALELEGSDSELSFSDAGQIPAWAQSFFAQLVKDGVITGYEDNTVRPDSTLTRTEMTVLLVRALDLEIDPNADVEFIDKSELQEWAIPYIATAFEAGLVKGVGDDKFAPNTKATRAEVLTLILNALAYEEN